MVCMLLFLASLRSFYAKNTTYKPQLSLALAKVSIRDQSMKKNYLYGFVFLCLAAVSMSYASIPSRVCGGVIIEEIED